MKTTDFEEICSDFLEFEEEKNLLNKKICGVYFWERIRFLVHKEIAGSLGLLEGGTDDDDSFSEYLSGARLLLRNIFRKNPYLSPETLLLFYGKGRRKRLDGNKWWDIYIDPILKELGESHVCLERPYKISHARPAKTKELRYTDVIQYTSTLLQKLGISSITLSERESELLDRIESSIEARFGVPIDLYSMVNEDLSQRRARLPLYKRLLGRINPEVAFLTAAYNGRETFVEACQSEGIPVVELQHGVITKYHMGYSFPNEYKHVFPNYFFSFGEFWSDTVDLPLPDDRVFNVGFTYSEKWFAEYRDIESADRIIFVSQPRIGERLSSFALAVSRSDAIDGEVVYKLHPKEYEGWEEQYPHLSNAAVSVISDEPPLYELLGGATTQVGVNSTAIYEGLQFGLDTYLLDAPGISYMEYLIESGYATVVSSPEEFIYKIESNATSGVDFDRTYFFESEPIEKFEDALETITNSQE
jgi:hypothetical protein